MNSATIQEFLKEPIISITDLSGGDIARSQKVITNKATYFVKSASFPYANTMFKEEVRGLKKIAATHTIGIPKIIGTLGDTKTAFLFLEFIESKSPSPMDHEFFGRKLAQLHHATTEGLFGFETDNFIGTLPQINSQNKDWVAFFVQNRLLPQLRMAVDNGQMSKNQLPSTDKMTTICEGMVGKVTPSLLHGDLWSGNYLISKNGEPFLIDPSVYYGHHEVDLAMTRLFGGFSNDFYGSYHEIIPRHPNQKERMEIYQLYYLLVHLNLFGSSYFTSVNQILRKYFL